MASQHSNLLSLPDDNLPRLTPRFLPPTNSSTFQSHIQVYAIPYGVLGFISHGLTFYVILCHMFGRRPLLPWQPLKKTIWNVGIVSLSSFISIILSAVTMARSRGSQALLILAGMQIVLGILVDAVHLHRLTVKAEGWSDKLGPWGVPMILTGIFSIWAFYQFPRQFVLPFCFKSHADLMQIDRDEDGKTGSILKSIALIVLLVWLGLTGLAAAFSLIVAVMRIFKGSAHFAVSAILFSCALFWFGDFGIATVSKNTMGMPSKQITALYYSFWIVERLPLLTF